MTDLISKLADIIPGVVYLFHLPEKRTLYIHPRIEEVLGYTPTEIQSKGKLLLPQLIHPEDLFKFVTNLEKLEKLGKGQFVEQEYRMRSKAGEWVWIYDRSQVYSVDQNGKVIEILGMAEDITEQKAIEMALENEKIKNMNTAKMAILGEMAGGIAHEINTPLSVIFSRTHQLIQLMQQESKNYTKMSEYLHQIERTCNRISSIIKSFRAFSRTGVNDPFSRVSLRQVIHDALELCREKFKQNEIYISVEYDSVFDQDEPPQVMGRAVQLTQVLLNLLSNAFDAISSQGSEARSSAQSSWVKITLEKDSGGIELSVCDSGPGVPTEYRSKIMQPFFTTKGTGMGTGMGLSLSAAIVEEHQGKLTLDESSPVTRFVVRLPDLESFEVTSSRAA